MNRPLESEFDGVDQRIADLKSVLWHYRFIRQEIDLHQSKSKGAPIPLGYLHRLKPIAERVESATKELQSATEKLCSALPKSC
jgi:hypothetical protein